MGGLWVKTINRRVSHKRSPHYRQKAYQKSLTATSKRRQADREQRERKQFILAALTGLEGTICHLGEFVPSLFWGAPTLD
ncbi:MAG: hypothetical protein CSA11_07950 [Chloroflexi bacterium]|nr:MAG: hypothetical protein CSA11_07950 [Chloroflexota bacterium]